MRVTCLYWMSRVPMLVYTAALPPTVLLILKSHPPEMSQCLCYVSHWGYRSLYHRWYDDLGREVRGLVYGLGAIGVSPLSDPGHNLIYKGAIHRVTFYTSRMMDYFKSRLGCPSMKSIATEFSRNFRFYHFRSIHTVELLLKRMSSIRADGLPMPF